MQEPTDPIPRGARAPEGRRPRRIGLRLFGAVSAWLLRALGATWRLRQLGQDPRTGRVDDPPQLAALFHESLIGAAHGFRDRGYGVAVSRSRDGDLVAATLARLGYADLPRGSSSKGGSAALLGLVRLLEARTTVSVLVDGPRGPARVSKPGIVALARRSGRPIQPVAFAARPAIRLSSWDRSLIPLPFARVVCAFGEPLAVASEPDDEEEEQRLAGELDRRLTRLHEDAERALARGSKPAADQGRSASSSS